MGRRQDPRPHPHAALRVRRVRRDQGLRDGARSGGLPAHAAHPAAVRQRQDLLPRHPVHGRRAHRRHQGDGAGQRDEVVLHPAARLPRLRRDGAQHRPVQGQRGHRRVAVGDLPGRRGHQARGPVQDQLVEAPRPQLAAAGGQGHGHVHQLVDGQARSGAGRVRRGDHPQRAGLRLASARARTSSSSATARSSPRRCRRARSRASPSTRCARSPPISGSTTASTTCCAATSTSPTRRSCRARRPRSCPIRSVDDREIGEPGPITRQIQEIFYATVKGEVDQYKDWNEYVVD